MFFTSTGRIGAILDMNDAMSLHMTALQRNMAKSLIGPGGVNHTKYVLFPGLPVVLSVCTDVSGHRRRAPATPRGHTDAEASYGFLDGDFLETFLSHAHPEQLLVGDVEAERITLPIDTVKNVLVQIQSFH